MRFIIVFCSVSLALSSNWGAQCSVDSLKFKIKEKVISLTKYDKELKLTGEVTNFSRGNLILYAFRKTTILDSSIDSIFFNDILKNGGAGNVLLLLDKNGNRKEIHVEACSDCENQNTEDSHNPNYISIATSKAKNIYRETSEVLNPISTKKVTLITSLSKINLERGEYKIYMIYYSGYEIQDIVDNESIKKDELKFKAKLMTGWIRSDTIKLIIE